MILDTSLSLAAEVTDVARSVFYYLLLIPYLSPNNLATMIHTMVTSGLNHCYLLYMGLPLDLTPKF